jgi:hypothetical protein
MLIIGGIIRGIGAAGAIAGVIFLFDTTRWTRTDNILKTENIWE